jgi:hypothetical protein
MIKTDTIYAVHRDRTINRPSGSVTEQAEQFAVTPDGIGMYWYDTLTEAVTEHGSDLTTIEVTYSELDTLREGTDEEIAELDL